MSAAIDELFLLMDADKGGSLSLVEVHSFCETLGAAAPPAATVARLFVQADTDGSGEIDRMEFSALCEGLKMLMKKTEAELVNAYSTAELKRLFTYLCTDKSGTMRKEDLRKALEMLNASLNLKIHGDTLTAKMRLASSNSGNTCSFEEFRVLLQTEICPGVPLTAVVSAFLEEETRRKERITKVKSMFERKNDDAPPPLTGKGNRAGAKSPSPKGAGLMKDGVCTTCEVHKTMVEELREQLGNKDSEISAQKNTIDEIQSQAAMAEVQRSGITKKLEQELADVKEFVEAVQSEKAELEQELKETKDEVLNVEAKRNQDIEEAGVRADDHLEAVAAECRSLKEEITRVRTRLTESEEKNETFQVDLVSAKERLHKAEESEKAIEGLMQSAMNEKQKGDSIVEAMRIRMGEKEDVLLARELELDRQVAGANRKQKELNLLQDTLMEKERAVRVFDKEMHEFWDKNIENVKMEHYQRQGDLEQRELELVQGEAELVIREELFEQKVNKAEQTSLPERTRRLQMLQQIEEDLCERERSLRQADRQYLSQLEECELSSVRDENSRLYERIASLEAQISRSTQVAVPGAGGAASPFGEGSRFGGRGNKRGPMSPVAEAAYQAAKKAMVPTESARMLERALKEYEPQSVKQAAAAQKSQARSLAAAPHTTPSRSTADAAGVAGSTGGRSQRRRGNTVGSAHSPANLDGSFASPSSTGSTPFKDL